MPLRPLAPGDPRKNPVPRPCGRPLPLGSLRSISPPLCGKRIRLMCRKYHCLPVNQKIKQSMESWLIEPISLTFIDCLLSGGQLVHTPFIAYKCIITSIHYFCGYSILKEMFHKAEEFLPKTTDSEVDEMDTSDTQWGWFYLAECGKWHMFQK